MTAGKRVAAVGRMLPPIGPDNVGGNQPDSGMLQQGSVFGMQLVPVPEPAALPDILAALGAIEIDPLEH